MTAATRDRRDRKQAPWREGGDVVALNRAVSVLIVDDYKTMLRIIRNLLKQIDFGDVDEAADGAEALAKLRVGNYGLVISDWNMQPMTGLELLQEVRADSRLRATPFIMVTAESKAENVVAAKQAGVSNYIVKPFNAPRRCATRSPRCWVMLDPATPLARVAVHGRDAAVGDGAREHAPPPASPRRSRNWRPRWPRQRRQRTASSASARCSTMSPPGSRRCASAEARAAAGELQIATCALYEACGFQDLTRTADHEGRRDGRRDRAAAGVHGGARIRPEAEGRGASETGPQTPASAMGQADVDRLLSALE